MVSIYDVAKKAGVAKSTVSKVLNGYAMVSDKTKKKVEEAVKELGYVPNPAAISLSKKQFDRAGLIVDAHHSQQFVDEITMQYLMASYQKAKEYHLDIVTFFCSQFEGMNAEEIISYLKSQRINGLIIYSLSSETKEFIKVVESGSFCSVLADYRMSGKMVSCVSINHKQAQYDVAKKTIEMCRTNCSILYLAGGRGGYITQQREAGMRRLMKETGCDIRTCYADFSEKKARELVLSYGSEADAIVCASDLMAVGAVYALKEMQMAKPVCGFDGIRLLGYIPQEIHTVKQDFMKISMCASDELIRLFSKKEGRTVELPYEILKIRYHDVLRQYR